MRTDTECSVSPNCSPATLQWIPKSCATFSQTHWTCGHVDLKDAVAHQLSESDDPRLISLSGILREWDCRFDPDQNGAAVWAALWPRFASRVTLALAGDYAGRLSAESPGDLASRRAEWAMQCRDFREESRRMMRGRRRGRVRIPGGRAWPGSRATGCGSRRT